MSLAIGDGTLFAKKHENNKDVGLPGSHIDDEIKARSVTFIKRLKLHLSSFNISIYYMSTSFF